MQDNIMTEVFTIRDVQPGDRDALLKTPGRWDREFVGRYFEDFFGDNNCYPHDKVFVGTIDGTVISIIGFCPDKLAVDDVCWLNWFYVDHKYQGRGYGGQMLDHVIEMLKAQKIRKLYVDTTSDRSYETAIRLYKRKGFKEEAVLRDYYGNGEHQIIFGLRL